MTTTEDTPTEPATPRSHKAPEQLDPFLHLVEEVREMRERQDRIEQDVERRHRDTLELHRESAGTLRHLVNGLRAVEQRVGTLISQVHSLAEAVKKNTGRLAVAERKLTLRTVATYAIGTGGALALTTTALVLSRLFLRWLGVEH
jgi:signal transduction histidine kinase